MAYRSTFLMDRTMINELPIEPLPLDEDRLLTFWIINQLDADRLDLMNPLDVLLFLEVESTH